MPLVGLRAEEPVEALEPAPRRPVAPRRGEVHLVGRAQMPLACHVRVPAQLAEDLGQHPVLRRDRAARVREPDRGLGDARHAVARVVAPGKQAGPRRRAQRRGVPLRVADTARRDPVDVGRLHGAAVAADRREADVVEHDVHHARRALGSLRRLKRRPIRNRVANIDVDDALERLAHDLTSVSRRRPSRGAAPTLPGLRRQASSAWGDATTGDGRHARDASVRRGSGPDRRQSRPGAVVTRRRRHEREQHKSDNCG